MKIYGNPNIIKNNLILYLDAANPKSYRRIGTTWNDLSVTKNDATSISGASFNLENKGNFFFNGVLNFIAAFNSNPTLANQVTIDVWVKVNPDNMIGEYLGCYIVARDNAWRLIAVPTGFTWVCATVSNAWYTLGTTASASVTIASDIWYNVVGTYDGANNRIYVNGILYFTGETISGNVKNTGENLYIGYGNASNVANLHGNFSMLKIYDRALTANEIIKNYDVHKGRYGY